MVIMPQIYNLTDGDEESNRVRSGSTSAGISRLKPPCPFTRVLGFVRQVFVWVHDCEEEAK